MAVLSGFCTARWRQALPSVALILAALALWIAPSLANEPRPMRGVALVIGQSDYEHLAELPNPANDARAIEELLNDLGFDTTVRDDRDSTSLRRDLDRFIEDARGADAAVLYYSGHGIEAGGENFLVPVDADAGALAAAADRLTPLSAFIEDLQATVPVTIVLLDACRTSPFPAGTTIRLDAAGPAVPVAASGLAETRGAVALSKAKAGDAGRFGIVIGFAAAPGQAALDGAPGGNSPYAASVLKHLAAMAGVEFGTVMRMVAEEVYLKTAGKQRPWVNDNLRRLLYFGGSAPDLAGEEGDILAERRQLLLTIAALPDAGRRQVERVAAQGGVPMDAVYAVLRALGQDVPDDPAKLEELLRRQAEDLKSFLDDRRTIADPDPELARLAALSDRAVAEGAIAAARTLRKKADTRIDELSAVVDRAEDNIRARRVEFAAEYARSAEVATLAFRHLEAADYYRKAFEQIERWDGDLAWQYKFAEVRRLDQHGDFKGDNSALLRSVEVGEQALILVDNPDDRDRWADMQHQIGQTLNQLGHRSAGTEYLRQAEAAFRRALTVRSRERTPTSWAGSQLNRASVLAELGMREPGAHMLEQAIEAEKLALTVYTREDYPADWALANSNLGNILLALAQRRGGTEHLKEAVATLHAALLEQTRESSPQNWADNQNNLGLALMRLGGHEAQVTLLEMAVERFRTALLERPRERMPLKWAQTQMNMGAALVAIGGLKTDVSFLQSGVDTLNQSLEAYSRKQDAPLWALSQVALASGYMALGTLRNSPETINQAIAAAASSLEVLTLEQFPFEWTGMQQTLAKATFRVGQMRADRSMLEAALAGLRGAIARIPKDDLPAQWLAARTTEAEFLATIGQFQADPVRLGEAVDAYAEVLTLLSPEVDWLSRADMRSGHGRALYLRGIVTNDETSVRRSVDEFSEVGESIDRERAPLIWAMTYRYLGDSFLWLGAVRSEPKLIKGAIAAYGLALEEFKPDTTPPDWGMTQGGLAYANVVAGALDGDRGRIEKGKSDLEATRERMRAAGFAQLDPYFDQFLAVADQFLAGQPAEAAK